MLAMNDDAVYQVIHGAFIAGKPRSYRSVEGVVPGYYPASRIRTTLNIPVFP
ncbi:hypothetical protein C4K22_1399 [Pseudomonas chlororaphis subsp. aurantiaca]|nr:hypothetical protein C4K24_1382 [Pseudomonas chlororaphis subsp. aurantiaca]AZD34159.1 hypothetical protein C4K22_1399 [Pseudomonas chlororaphis subsp. aurantiaca]AZD40494.1 hypothetical protein C4K21_1403 [Pseudomonas chlororaphis subsp. aurantiaca]AZD53263.1 hypothetical protein C4K19_1459 [Pseudomonas chlororaphis subsp. aurantiaca]AZD59347.1 hypothetical protein C4K18_1357 [Pseudomonas chlororaphis subsp. aurantiaca]